jgi:hypothetical protein
MGRSERRTEDDTVTAGEEGGKKPRQGEADATCWSSVDEPRGAQQARRAYRSTVHYASLINNNPGTAPPKPASGGVPMPLDHSAAGASKDLLEWCRPTSTKMEIGAVGSGRARAVAPQTSGSLWPSKGRKPSSEAAMLL